MWTQVQNNTLGPLLSAEEWVEVLKGRKGVNFHTQNGQYAEDQQQPPASDCDVAGTSKNSGASAISQETRDPEVHSLLTGDQMGVLKPDKVDINDYISCSSSQTFDSVDELTGSLAQQPGGTTDDIEASLSIENYWVNTHESPCSSLSEGNSSPGKKESQHYNAKQRSESSSDSSEFASEFFGISDMIHSHYHWNELDKDVLYAARERGLEPTTLGHVLTRRNRLWAQVQCLDNTAVNDFKKHLELYQKQFEAYGRSGDGWVKSDNDHKVDPLYLQKGTYLKGAERVPKIMKPGPIVSPAKGDKVVSEEDPPKRKYNSKHTNVEHKYNWNNVIYCPSFECSNEFIRRYARKTTRMYRNLYDCLINGWIHPGLVVCEVKDATHPVRFSTPPDQDCYTVVYAGPAIPENATQRVIFGEYTGIVYREESVEESVFEYAFELNFSAVSWISADVEVTKDTAEITEENGVVILPNNARFVLDSSTACNELSLVNHYQSVKVYAGEMWVAPNCEWQQVFLDGWPHVVLTSKLGVAINPGDELVADFGGLWFSKVEETAHKAIRNELIEYRLGLRRPANTVQQLISPKRPLSKIDNGLTSNSSSNAYAKCAICYNCNEEQAEVNAEDLTDSIICDGCDRYFHIYCVSSISRASAVYLSKDGLGEKWGPLEKTKGIVGGAGVFYCSFCRHLAKKIYMHDMGCDYMPLAKSTYVKDLEYESSSPSSSMEVSHAGYKCDTNNQPVDDKEPQEDICEVGVSMDLQMEIEGVCTVSIASGKGTVRLPGKKPWMKPANNVSLFELEVAEQRQLLAKLRTAESITHGGPNKPRGASSLDRAFDNGYPRRGPYGKNGTSLGEDDGAQSYRAKKPDVCPTCQRDYPTDNDHILRTPFLKELNISTGYISSREVHRGIEAIGLESKRPEMSKFLEPAGKDSNNATAEPDNKSYATDKSSCNKKEDKPVETPSRQEGISTGSIGDAADYFISKEKEPSLRPRFLAPDSLGIINNSNEATLVDYLWCKYLAGTWQVEPFAIFGDCVRACTECYAKSGPKANVYVCRLLKRHLTGNFDHPLNTTPLQMRELVLMAYEQHVQMLLRLLVLKNISITFMCKLCCHFISRQILQNRSVQPPLPFSREFLGSSSGPSEGLLSTPGELVNYAYCKTKKVAKGHQKVLESHLKSFVSAVKNQVSSVPISSKSDPSLNYKVLNSMGALSEEFSRLANCDGIVEYLNDLMSHKVLEADSTPSQLPETLTKEELKRFATFRHLAERSPDAFTATTTAVPSKLKIKAKKGDLIPLLGVVAGVTCIYRKFTDGYYNGVITKCVEDATGTKRNYMVTYSDGDDEMLTEDNLLEEVISNLVNIRDIIKHLSPNDERNLHLLIAMRQKQANDFESLVHTARSDLLRGLTLHRSVDVRKQDTPKKGSRSSDSPSDDPSSSNGNVKRKCNSSR